MGIIQTNSIKSSVVLAVGYGISILSSLFIYPQNTEAYGFAAFFYNMASFFIPFVSIGLIPVIYRFYPKYSDKEKQQEFLNGTTYMLLINLTTFIIIMISLKPFIIKGLGYLGFNQELLNSNYIGIIATSIIMSFIFFITAFLHGAKKIIVPLILQNFSYKLFLPSVILLSIFWTIEDYKIALLILVFHTMILIILFLYHNYRGIEKWSKLKLERLKNMKSEIRSYSIFSLFNKIATTLAFRIDVIMIAFLLNMDAVGKYAILLALANIIEIPKRSIDQIAAPVVSDLMSNKQYPKIIETYKKSALVLLITGLFLFGVIWVSLSNLLNLYEGISKLLPFIYVFFFIGLAKLVDMVTGINNYILIYSDKFKMNLVFVSLLGFMNIILNFILIEKYQIVGAAIATLISLFLFNLLKFIFILVKFKMSPFSSSHLYIILIFLFILIPVFYIRISNYELVNIFVKSTLFSITFLTTIYYLKFSEDLNNLVLKFAKQIKKRRR